MVSLVVVLCGVLLSVYGVYSGLSNDKQGPFDVLIRGFRDCSEENDTSVLIRVFTKLQKVNRTTVLVGGRLNANITISDEVKVKFSADQYTSQGWKEKYFYSEFGGKGLCTMLQDFNKDFARRLFLAFGGEDGKCPIPPGSRDSELFALVLKNIAGVPIFFYGKYRAFFRLHYPDLSAPQIGCILGDIDVVPKQRKSG